MCMKKLITLLTAMFFAIPSLFAYSVDFYFQDGEDDFELDDPGSMVNIWNATEETPVTVTGEYFMTYTYSSVTMLRIQPDDFDFEVTVEVQNADLDGYTLEKDENQWFLTLFPDADGAEIFVVVYQEGKAPGAGSQVSEVATRFNLSAKSGSGITNPSDFVNISYFNRSTFKDTTVEFSDNFGSATVVPGTSFTLTPSEGYEISVTTFSDEGVATISQPGQGDTEWYISISDTPTAEDATFFVEVAKAAQDTPPATDPDQEAVVTQISELTWKIQWKDYDYIVPVDIALLPGLATLTNLTTNQTINLQPGRRLGNEITVKGQLYFDYNTSNNYLTLELDGMNLSDGKYELVIPEGYINLGNRGQSEMQPNVEQFLSIIIGEEVPELDFPVNVGPLEVNAFSITWDNVVMLSPGTTTGSYIQNTATNEKYDMLFLVDELYSKANIRIEGNKLRVNLTNNYPDLPSGQYKFYLPANYVKFNGSDKGNEVIDNVILDFYYWREGPIVGNGPTEEGLYTVTWTAASEISYNDAYKGDAQSGIKGVAIFDANDDLLNVPQANLTFSGNVMTVNLNGLDLPSGSTLLYIPDDCIYVTVGGEKDLTFGTTLRFDYYNPNRPPVGPGEGDYKLFEGEPTWNIKDGDTVFKDTLVTLTWGDYQLTYNEDVEDEAGLYASMDYGWIAIEFGKEVSISDDGHSIVFNLSTLPSSFYESFFVPEAYVKLDVDGQTYYNTSTSLYNVTVDNTRNAVEGIQAEDGLFVVYNIHGVKVLETEDAAELKNLAKGLYIINGKKIIK